jgi:TonB family protein
MFSNYKYFSTGVSVLLHILLFAFLLGGFKGRNNPDASVFEVGLGGEQGGGGGGEKYEKPASPEEKIPTKEPSLKQSKVVEKTKVKEVEGTGTNPNANPNATGTGGGPGTGTGTGTGGGGLVLPIPKPVVVKPPVSEVYLVAVEQMPEPIGGMESVKDKIPAGLKGTGKGTVYILAYIDENGTVRKVLLSKGIGGEADQAALSAVKRTRFRAGRKAGVPVKVQMLVAISF